MNSGEVDRTTPTWKIWNERWSCRMRKFDLTSTNEILTRGFFTTGDVAEDNDMINELIDVQLTINEMIEHYREGHTVRLVRLADTVLIYELVIGHLSLWEQHLKWSGMYTAPYEDLIEMDKFASSLHEHAKYLFKEPSHRTTFGQMFGAVTSFSRRGKQKAAIAPVLTPEEIAQQYPARDSMEEMFNLYRLEGKGR